MNYKGKSRKLTALVLLTALMPVLSHAKVGILARFADDVILENLEVGRTYNLMQRGGLPYRVTNGGDARVEVAIDALIPEKETLKPGYEPIPDPNWVRIVPNSFVLDPGESGQAAVIITVPDEEQYVNRSFQVYLKAHTINTGFIAAGAGHRLRFSTGRGPESLKKEKKEKAMLDLNLDFKPLSLYVSGVEPGKKVRSKKLKGKELKLINWANNPINMKLISIKYRKDFNLPPGYEPAPDPKWLEIETDEFVIDGNEIKDVRYRITVPDKEEYYGKKYAFIVKAEITGTDIPLELYSRVYVTTKDKSGK